MKSNKIKALEMQIESGKRNNDRTKIIAMLKERSMTLDHFVMNGIRKETVTARLSELEEMGFVKKRQKADEKLSWFVFVENEMERAYLRERVEDLKKKAFFKRGLINGWLNENNGVYYSDKQR